MNELTRMAAYCVLTAITVNQRLDNYNRKLDILQIFSHEPNHNLRSESIEM
jgi:hypothetical protein